MKKTLYWVAISVLMINQPAFAQDPKAAMPGQMTNSSSLELLRRLDQLTEEVRQLRGDMEVVNHELSGIKSRQRELYLDMDRRLSDLELASVNAPAGGSNTQPAQADSQNPQADKDNKASVATVASKPEPPTRQEKDAYRSAFNLLKEGRYDRSIKAFADFMSSYPGSSYADNAQYWLGEANYVSRKYSAAVKEFGKVIDSYPESTKVPDAMLKLGFTHYELKQWDKSREVLSAVVQKFPKSSAAKLAETRLKRIQSEGH